MIEHIFNLESHLIKGNLDDIDRAIKSITDSDIKDKEFILAIMNAVRKEHIYATGEGIGTLSKDDFCQNVDIIAENSQLVRHRMLKHIAAKLGENIKELDFDCASSASWMGEAHKHQIRVMWNYRNCDVPHEVYITYDELFPESK